MPTVVNRAVVAAIAVSILACGSAQEPEAEEPMATTPPPGPVDAASAPAEPPAPPSPPAPTPVPNPPAPTPAASFSEATNAFAMDLWGKLRARTGNLTFSPASIWVALAMTHEGARGDTATDMARAMRMPSDADAARADAAAKLTAWNAAGRGPMTLRLVNRLFGEKAFHFEAPFLRTARERWGAPLEPTDFVHASEPARARINGWVARETRDRIRELLPPGSLTADTRLVLTNAVYFLGKWAHAFDRRQTQDMPFFTAPGQSAPAPTMQQTAVFAYAEQDGVQVVEMPYRGSTFAMTVVVPRAMDGLSAVEARLDAATFSSWTQALHERRVRVLLPRFTIDPPGSIALSRVLVDLGMARAFDRREADFTGIANPPSPDDRLSVSEVFHKAFVKVDEEGTEAAAATAVVMGRGTSIEMPPPEIRADHPFLFFLRDTASGAILFAGRVADPRAP